MKAHTIRRFVGMALIAGLAAACAHPPVEEIASAEAALQAAREAEAPKYAPEPYGEAENLMTQTYRFNDLKDYENARTSAVETREKAEFARDLALRNRAGAAEDDKQQMDGEQTAAEDTGVNTAAETAEAVQSEAIGAGALDEGSRLADLQPVLFDFDDYTVRADQLPKVEAAAEWLKQNPAARIQLEGHTDERGSTDYNLALGSRRANAVRQVLQTLGVDGSRIDVRSYGEELPADPGHDEAAWARNRRVEFVILTDG